MIDGNKSSPSLTDPKYGKPVKILVWINGEFDSPQREVKINSSDLRSFTGVLNFLTKALKPRFGAVRKLYHLRTRKMVNCLKHIKTNERFVAVGVEKIRFKKNGYLTEEERHAIQKTTSLKNSVQIEENINSLLNFMDYTEKKKRTVIYVMVSGRTCQDPLKLVLTRDDLNAWSMILEYLAYQLDVEEGVQFLCKVNGKIIFEPKELRHGDLYVAVPFMGKFVRMDYIKLFEELRPNKIVKIRKPKRNRTAVFATKKYKTKNLKCLTTKCSCLLLPSPASTSSVDVQRAASSSTTKSEQKKAKTIKSEDTNLGSSSVDVQRAASSSTRKSEQKKAKTIKTDDTNLEAYQAYLQESSVDFSDDAEGEAVYDSIEELVQSILDEIIDTCLVDLEQRGSICDPYVSGSTQSDLEDKRLSYVAPQVIIDGKGKTSIASCCAKNGTQRRSTGTGKIMTTFAEIARSKEMLDQVSPKTLPRQSRTSISNVDSDEFKASVTFLETEDGLPHQETIYEENEPVLNLDIESHLNQQARQSILKVKSGDLYRKTSVDTEPPLRSSSEEDAEELTTQDLFDRIRRTSSFSRKTRDSVMITADRLNAARMQDNPISIGTQKNLEESGDNDKSVQAFDDEEEEIPNNNVVFNISNSDKIQDNILKNNDSQLSQNLNKDGSSDSPRLSDSYNNNDANDEESDNNRSNRENSKIILGGSKTKVTSKSQQETGKRRISFGEEGRSAGAVMNCCNSSMKRLTSLMTITENRQEIESNSEDNLKSKSFIGAESNGNESNEIRGNINSETTTNNSSYVKNFNSKDKNVDHSKKSLDKGKKNLKKMSEEYSSENANFNVSSPPKNSSSQKEKRNNIGNDQKSKHNSKTKNLRAAESNSNESNEKSDSLKSETPSTDSSYGKNVDSNDKNINVHVHYGNESLGKSKEKLMTGSEQNITENSSSTVSNNQKEMPNNTSKRLQGTENTGNALSESSNSIKSKTKTDGKSNTLYWTCLRENCATFACSEICLKAPVE